MMRRDILKTGDLTRISCNIRAADLEEILAWGHHDPLEALTISVGLSSRVEVLRTEKSAPVCVFGVSEVHDIGVPWMVGTPLIYTDRKAFMRFSHEVVSEWVEEYPLLTNYVSTKNRHAIRWLARLGFTVEPTPCTESKDGTPFHQFYRYNNVSCTS